MLERLILVATFTIICMLAACGDSQEKIAAQKQKAIANDTLKVLRKIEAATQVESSLSQYNQLVIDAKAQVNEAASVLSSDELKREFESSIEAYADAGMAWNELDTNGYFQFGFNEPGESLKKKYNLKLYAKSLTGEATERMVNPNYEREKRKEVLSIIWAVAKTHVDRAASLIQ